MSIYLSIYVHTRNACVCALVRFGSDVGNFSFETIKASLLDVGHTLHEREGDEYTHVGLATLTRGKYIALGYSDNIRSHAIAIDADAKLCICDSVPGVWSLCAQSILKSLPFGVASVRELVRV